MTWPLSQDYNEAIQSPAHSFADPDLRCGEVAANALGLPKTYSGNFADVYEMRCPGGGRWAVKCFTREVPGLRERYQEISRHLRQVRLPFIVDFSYLEQGIRIAGRWYPVLKMQWVEGLALNQFVSQYLDKPLMLEALLQIWTRMAKYLRTAEVAHCDLQHGNVLLVPGASANSLALKLVDYDGMFVPALARRKSGEVGHPSYQHPQRLRQGTYSLEVDRFPLLLVATALRALAVKGRTLWEKYDNGDNMLFRETDLQAPTRSSLFLDLFKSGDAMTVSLADQMLKALRGGLESAPLLDDVLPEVPLAVPVRPARPLPTPAWVDVPTATAVAVAPVAVATIPLAVPVRPAQQPQRMRRAKKGSGRMAAWIAALVVLAAGIGAVAILLQAMPPLPVETLPSHPLALNGPAIETRPQTTRPSQPRPTLPETGKPTPKGTGNAAPTSREEPGPAPAPADEKSITNAIGMRLMRVPPGTFAMGSSAAEIERFKKSPIMLQPGWEKLEGPQHEVKITRALWMGAWEVTQGEYEAVMGSNPSHFAATGEGKKQVIGLDTRRFPVESVTWHDSVEFCKKLSDLPAEKKAGRTYRLPTEAEWEYACRAGTTTTFHFGNSLSVKQANFNGENPFGNPEKELRVGRTVRVGSYPPNAWGLHDMHGNVHEWCLDGPRPYTPNAVENPRGPEADNADGVLRGGSWAIDAGVCRSAFRKVRGTTRYRTSHSGFRVVCEQ